MSVMRAKNEIKECMRRWAAYERSIQRSKRSIAQMRGYIALIKAKIEKYRARIKEQESLAKKKVEKTKVFKIPSCPRPRIKLYDAKGNFGLDVYYPIRLRKTDDIQVKVYASRRVLRFGGGRYLRYFLGNSGIVAGMLRPSKKHPIPCSVWGRVRSLDASGRRRNGAWRKSDKFEIRLVDGRPKLVVIEKR